MQPWGQIYVKDPGASGFSASSPLCENVTYFFALSVEECYDCFYMNSFISDAKFTTQKNPGAGPICCNAGSALFGSGKDRYYLTLSFDNTENNPYLYHNSQCYVGVDGINAANVSGLLGDGIVPDLIGYNSAIATAVAQDVPFEARFTLNGILTYTWNLKKLFTSDVAPDFIGTGSYAANGYGFIALYCGLLTGTANFAEKAVTTACCTGADTKWLDNKPSATGWEGNPNGPDGWYGVGAEWILLNNVNDTAYNQFQAGNGGIYSTPINVGASLTYHENFDLVYPGRIDETSGWPSPGVVIAPFVANP